MGKKVHPVGFRIGTLYPWVSRWYADKKTYRHMVEQDARLRRMLMARLVPAGITHVDIERSRGHVEIELWVSRAGLVIGRGGKGLEELKRAILEKLGEKDANKVEVRVQSVDRPDLSAQLLATFAAEQLAKRLPAMRIMNQVLDRAKRAGAKGVRVMLSGRIGGADIARVQKMEDGTIPLHTVRADIDFAKVDARTKFGTIGVKVWVCREVV